MLKIGLVDKVSDSNEYSDAIQQSSDFIFSGFYIPSSKNFPGENLHAEYICVTSYKDFIKSCDALIFPKVSNEFYPLLVLALKNSRHIMIGNPVNLDIKIVDHLFKLAEEANVILKVIQTIQYHSALQAATGYIKNPVYLDIRNESSDELESFTDTLHKCVQPAVYINQTSMKKLQAVSIPPNNGYPDIINARIEFNNGCVANVTSSRYSDLNRFFCRIHQENQHIDIDFANYTIEFKGFEDSKSTPSSNFISVANNQPFKEELTRFADNIRCNSFHLNHSESGYHTYIISRKILDRISYRYSRI